MATRRTTRWSQQTTFGTAVRLAMVVSTVAAVLAIALEAVGEVSRTPMVLAVVVVGFSTSWVQTGRAGRAETHSHRGALVPARHSIG